MKRIITLGLFFSFCTIAFSQVSITEIGLMNDINSEPSGFGILYNATNGHFEYWTHNDKNNPDDIYCVHLDDPMNIIKTIDVGTGYEDWEDMANDDAGNLYMADFGDSVGANDLQVVKIPNPESYNGSPPFVDIIEYVYPFNGVSDCEAIIHLDGHLYIFTKQINPANNPNLIEGYTYCFKIPDVPHPNGLSWVAELIGSFQTMMPGDNDPSEYRITGADISPDKKKLMLLGYHRMWIFSCFEDDDFFGGTVSHFETTLRQYEGVGFINNHEVVIVKEGALANPNYNPKIYHIDLSPYMDGSCIDCNKCVNGDFANSNLAWTKFEFGNGSANLNMSGGLAEFDIQTLGTSGWHINLRHKSIVIENNKTYKISYRAWAEDNRNISVIANNRSGSMGYAYFSQAITTTPTLYEHTFTMTDPDDYNCYLSFNVGTQFAHKVFFDDIKLEEMDCICPQNKYFIADINNQVEHYETQNNIYGNNLIIASDVIYDAANCVELSSGFEVPMGTIFEAYNDGCGGN